MEENDSLQELKADPEQKRNQKRSVGLNGELLAGIWVSGVSIIWLILSVILAKTYFMSNLYMLGIGILILILGLIKYNKIKNTDLDF